MFSSKSKKNYLILAVAFAVAIIAALAITVGIKSAAAYFSHKPTIKERIAEGPKSEAPNAMLDASQQSTERLLEVKSSKVAPFFVESRMNQISHFPCQNCHVKEPESDKIGLDAMRTAHWDIDFKHMPAKKGNCFTCHDRKKRNKLHLITGETIPIDSGFRLCGQCHYQQRADWEYGSHGKRLSGWGYVRVVKNCTACHSPHHPAFETRLPATFVTFPEQ